MNELTRQYELKEKRLDRRTALLCALLANCFRTKDGKEFTIEDFMPQEQDSELKTNDPDMADKLLFMAASLGSKIERLN